MTASDDQALQDWGSRMHAFERKRSPGDGGVAGEVQKLRVPGLEVGVVVRVECSAGARGTRRR